MSKRLHRTVDAYFNQNGRVPFSRGPVQNPFAITCADVGARLDAFTCGPAKLSLPMFAKIANHCLTCRICRKKLTKKTPPM